MTYPLFTRVALREDFPEYQLCRGDVATIVDRHEAENSQETGYSLEVFNAIGETIAVLVVEESKIEPLRENEIFHIRQFHEAAFG
ncbi:MAG: DUF4926 domain-containing protein [Deltaproteobacteria bacterium]|nr:DUF4926 domain-containing protein [Deltaproteobacteria bacterium]